MTRRICALFLCFAMLLTIPTALSDEYMENVDPDSDALYPELVDDIVPEASDGGDSILSVEGSQDEEVSALPGPDEFNEPPQNTAVYFAPMMAGGVQNANTDDFTVSGNTLTRYNGAGGNVVIPDNLGILVIGEGAFADCIALTGVQLPPAVTTIGSMAFQNCISLQSVAIPAGSSLAAIRDSAFQGCESLTAIDFSGAAGLAEIGTLAFSGCKSLSQIALPDTISRIGNKLFENCEMLTDVRLPANATTIGMGAFSGCSALQALSIPATVTSIGDEAFENCASLSQILLPSGITAIGSETFRGCAALSALDIPGGVKSVGTGAFALCASLTGIVLPAAINAINAETFMGCTSLASLDIPANVSKIGNSAFKDCAALTALLLPEEVTSIGYAAFSGCENLQSVNVPGGVGSIGKDTFRDCRSLAALTLPGSVEYIGAGAFQNCAALQALGIPAAVTEIGDAAFMGCANLQQLTLPATLPEIGDSAFEGCASLTALTLPTGMNSIGSRAFFGCALLSAIAVPDGVATLGSNIFEGCQSLVKAELPIGINIIPERAFYGCASLQTVDMPGTVTAIRDEAFLGCNSLVDITIPNDCGNIGDSAFEKVSDTIPTVGVFFNSVGYRYCYNKGINLAPRDYVPVQSVTLDPKTADLDINGSVTLTPTITDEYAVVPYVNWTSSNPNVASVKDGVVTALDSPEVTDGHPVTVTITAKAMQDDPFDTCDVTVHYVPVSQVTLSQDSCFIEMEHSLTLTQSMSPANASHPYPVWSSSDDAIARVEDGVVTAVSPGTATITCRARDDAAEAKCVVTVFYTPVSGITLSESALTLQDGQTSTLTYTLAPDNATHPFVVWSSSDSSVATVTDDGVVTAVTSGQATITCKARDDDAEATCAVTVYNPVTDVTLSKSSLSLIPGQSSTLAYTLAPDNATNPFVVWSSSNDRVATVADGVVTAVNPGEATVTCKARDDDAEATCTVTVYDNYVPVSSVTLNTTTLKMAIGETAALNYTLAPADATNPFVVWSSDNSAVATVAGGAITAVSTGEATITCKARDDDAEAKCTVTVLDAYTPVSSITLNTASLDLQKGKTAKLTYTLAPVDATSPFVVWRSSDENVATVEDGVVTAVNPGEATITCKARDDEAEASCAVTVYDQYTPISEITLNTDSLGLQKGKTAKLTCTIVPSDATSPFVEWSSSDSAVATVEDGMVTAIADGTATITCKARDDEAEAECTVTVYDHYTPISSIALSDSELTLEKGKSATLTYTLKPDDATVPLVVWSTNDASIAKVENGRVTAVSPGTAIITCKASEDVASASCTVTVPGKPKPVPYTIGVVLDSNRLTLPVGSKYQLGATVMPENAEDKTLTWSSSNNSIVTVKNGELTAKDVGTCSVTATTFDGKSASATIRVEKPINPESVKLDQSGTITLAEGKTLKLVATLSPGNAVTTLTWSSSKPAAATVNTAGLVTAVKKGTTTIAVKTSNGKKAKVKINVVKPPKPKSVKLNKSGTITLVEGDTLKLKAKLSPSDAVTTLTWSSSRKSVAKVDANGLVTAGKKGSATITVKTANGKKATLKIKVVKPSKPTAIKLNKTGTVKLRIDKTLKLKAKLSPGTARSKLTWRSSDTSVAVVSSKGVVTGLKSGTAKITVKTANGKKASVKIKVSN